MLVASAACKLQRGRATRPHYIEAEEPSRTGGGDGEGIEHVGASDQCAYATHAKLRSASLSKMSHVRMASEHMVSFSSRRDKDEGSTSRMALPPPWNWRLVPGSCYDMLQL